MNILFFDDTRLYHRHNLERDYGVPELLGSFDMIGSGWVCQWPSGMWKENGTWYMPVMLMKAPADEEAQQNAGALYTVMMMKSSDGENWEPDNRAAEFGYENPHMPNQCMWCADNEEPGYIFYDEYDIPERRYKALTIKIDHAAHWVDDVVYCSANAFQWKPMRGACWSCRGAEPGVSVFKIEEKHKAGVALRPTWGDRRICVSTTDNFQSFTYPRLKVMPDSIDPSELEFYGMRVRPYKGYYIGLLWQYHTRPTNENKFHGGKIDCQLAYSLNGIDWFRSLRKPFIGNGPEGSITAGMVFPAEIAQVEDGSLRIYGAAFEGEHAAGYRINGRVAKFKLREDGFMRLIAGEEEGYIATRPVIVNDSFDINIKCDAKATCAVYNLHGRAVLEGFGHEDCIPFTGDDTHWVPKWKNHDMSELKGRTVCIHIKLSNGELYAINGDITPVTCHEAIRYTTQGVTVDTTGF